MLFKEEAAGSVLQPAVLTLRIQPHEGISLRFVAKVPGENINVGNVLMTMTYADAFKRPISEAYERLLARLHARRRDAVQPPRLGRSRVGADPAGAPGLGSHARACTSTSPARAGPAAADEMIARDGHQWRELVVRE